MRQARRLYRDLQLPDPRAFDGERRRQAQAGVQRVAIDICSVSKSRPMETS
jgi:hypothetical protein